MIGRQMVLNSEKHIRSPPVFITCFTFSPFKLFCVYYGKLKGDVERSPDINKKGKKRGGKTPIR